MDSAGTDGDRLPPLVAPGRDLDREEIERYSRHILIPDVGMIGQRRICNARVLVIGAGGLGSPALTYLAAAGVGTIGIVDFDRVEGSNLQRQVIHGEADLGRSKLASAADSIAGINSNVKVRLHEVHVAADNALPIFRDYDLVVDGTDNFATRYLVNDACALVGIPYVWGSIFRFEGQASVFYAGHGPQYRDVYPTPPPVGSVPSCAEGGVFGVLCATIGSVMGTEAIKLITGIGQTLLGRLLVYNALEMSFRQVPISVDPAGADIIELADTAELCLAAGSGGTDEPVSVTIPSDWSAAQSVTPGTLREMMRSDRGVVLIDVREPGEHEIAAIDGDMLIPVGDIVSRRALAKIPRDRPVVLYCKTGGRSARALAVLHDAGLTTARHLAGGIEAWRSSVDPMLARY